MNVTNDIMSVATVYVVLVVGFSVYPNIMYNCFLNIPHIKCRKCEVHVGAEILIDVVFIAIYINLMMCGLFGENITYTGLCYMITFGGSGATMCSVRTFFIRDFMVRYNCPFTMKNSNKIVASQVVLSILGVPTILFFNLAMVLK